MDIEERYENRSPKSRAHLIYGTKLRYAKCLVSNAESALRLYANTFTDEEMSTIHRISQDAQERARKEREETLRKLDTTESATDSRASFESRTYAGK